MGNQTNRTQASQPSSIHYMDQIICEIPESRSVQFQVFLYHRRKINPLKNVVTIGGVKSIARNSLSKLQRPLIKVYIQKVMLRLSQAEINIQQANYVLKQSLNGFINLVRYYGRAFIVHDDLIFLNENHEIKVWLNSNLAQNYIDENLSQPVSQIEMFADLVNCICSKIASEQDRDMFMQIARIAEQQVGLYFGQNLQKFNKNYLDNVYKALLKNENAKLKLERSANESQTNYNNTKQFRSYAISVQHSPQIRSPKRFFQQQCQDTQRDYFANYTLAKVKKSLDILNRNQSQPDEQECIMYQTERPPVSSDRKLVQQLLEFKGNLNKIQERQDFNPEVQSRQTLLKKPKSISAQKTIKNKTYKEYLSTYMQTENTPKMPSSKQNSCKSFTADIFKKVQESSSSQNNYQKFQRTPKKNNKVLPLFIKQRQSQTNSGQKTSQFNITQKFPKISEKSFEEQESPVVPKKAKYAIKLQIQAPDREIIPKIQISFQKSPRIKSISSKNSSRKTSNLSSALAHETRTRFKTYESETQNNNQRQRISNQNNIDPIDERIEHIMSNQYNEMINSPSQKKYFFKKQQRPYLNSQGSEGNFKFQISSPSEFEQQQKFNQQKERRQNFFRKNTVRNKNRDEPQITQLYQAIIKHNKLSVPEENKNNTSLLNYSNSSLHNQSYYRQLAGNHSKHLEVYSDNAYQPHRQDINERE